MTTTPAAAQLPYAQQPYELFREPDGTAWTARENLTDILARELLGPMYGDFEVIRAAPDTVYPIGRIAPKRLTDVRNTDPETEDEGSEVGTADDARTSTGVPLASVDDSAVDGDEDAVEDTGPKRGLMIPASMGLRFQVPLDLDRFTVRASWGVYHSRNVEPEDPSGGRQRREFVRTPIDVPVVVEVSDLVPGVTVERELRDAAVLRIDSHQDGDRRLVEVALCNDAEFEGRIPVSAWMFQTKLYVEADGQRVFLPVRDALEDEHRDHDGELNRLTLQYRDRLEFAIGRTCSVDWPRHEGSDPVPRRMDKVWTTWLPVSETPNTQATDSPDVITDMKRLAVASVDELRSGLMPIVTGYQKWLEKTRPKAAKLPTHLAGEADEAIQEAEKVRRQLATGIEYLLAHDAALQCFRFMNLVMADQRVHTEITALRNQDASLSVADATALVAADGAGRHSWRMFQLAFVLMQIPAMCNPTHQLRSDGTLARVELLFFPTGGGKTEAYLGLAAFTFAIRRLQGVVDSVDGPLDGRSGLAVLMRYTLRLLTAQQFQRASTMVCAAELVRREQPDLWGEEPFRIGLWVGTKVSPKRVSEAEIQLRSAKESGWDHGLTVLQVKRCPWCGTPITKGNVDIDSTLSRVYVYCGDEYARCPFAQGGEVEEGLPVLTTDEEIYRLAPTYVIATVDKFARLAREGEAASLFGYVSKKCDRHGYVHPDYNRCTISDNGKHPASKGHPAASARPTGRLRPPDLIIQDELHLITGALGTTVGLFEVAIDTLTAWQTPEGDRCQPLIVASSATVRNAVDQVRGLYGRRTAIFPPQVLDAGDTWFSTEKPISAKYPGRRYVGVCASGVRLTAAEIRLAEVLMAAGQLLFDRDPTSADAYMTMVGYFNATRELAGMARYMQDDVQTALAKGRPWSRLPRRYGTAFGRLNADELTARVSSSKITDTLDQMAVPFDPDFDTTDALRERVRLTNEKQPVPERPGALPYDYVLATSMLQVGVDVSRLGLMMLVGQPKNTAEYIQASSRVGRSASDPGLVVTLGNWARPRDLAHFEQFRHYHETFYSQVEALSVTPFSVTSIDRGLEGVLVSAARVMSAVKGVDGLSPEEGANRVEAEKELLEDLIERLTRRSLAASDEEAGRLTRDRLTSRLGHWINRRKQVLGERRQLVYEKVKRGSPQAPLLISAEASTRVDMPAGAPFVVPNSMREVQPEINILVSPDPQRLFIRPPDNEPAWTFPAVEED